MDNIAGADRLSVSHAYIIASVPQFAIIECPSVTSITESLQIGSRVSLSFIVGGGCDVRGWDGLASTNRWWCHQMWGNWNCLTLHKANSLPSLGQLTLCKHRFWLRIRSWSALQRSIDHPGSSVDHRRPIWMSFHRSQSQWLAWHTHWWILRLGTRHAHIKTPPQIECCLSRSCSSTRLQLRQVRERLDC